MINIDGYSDKITNFIKMKKLSCVYLISPMSGSPTKIGFANDIVHRLADVQVGNWVPLVVQYLLWMQGAPVARRVETTLHEKYNEYSIGGEWFECNYSIVESNIDVFARVLYPSLTPITHQEMIQYATRKIEGKYDQALARFGMVP